jgi:NAD(P)-dependent dehydrogenase (short-subunit alcohol dehydrogenase family)
MADAGKVVVVTGAGSGLGRSCAQALLDDGFHVVLVGRRRELVDQVAHPWSGTWGRVDVLVNNAGTSGGVAEIDLDDCRTTVEVNHRRAHVHPAGVRRDAASGAARWRIINNGSMAAHVPRPSSVAYTVTKHAVTGLTRSLALDGRARDFVPEAGKLPTWTSSSGTEVKISPVMLSSQGPVPETARRASGGWPSGQMCRFRTASGRRRRA